MTLKNLHCPTFMERQTKSPVQVPSKTKAHPKSVRKDQRVRKSPLANTIQSTLLTWILHASLTLQLKVNEAKNPSAPCQRKNKSSFRRIFCIYSEPTRLSWMKLTWKSKLWRGKFKTWRPITRSWSKSWMKKMMKTPEIN